LTVSEFPCLLCGERHPVSAAEAEGRALIPVPYCPNATRQLGPEHRNRVWRDKAGWMFAWNDGFWSIFRPNGMLADDMIEPALNARYAGSPYGPFVMVRYL
jgi:hypothetical protein